jgi:ribose transport system substrate-binding protein
MSIPMDKRCAAHLDRSAGGMLRRFSSSMKSSAGASLHRLRISGAAKDLKTSMLVHYHAFMKPLKFVAFFAFALQLAVATHAGATLDIAVIPKGTSHEYWKSVHAGAIKARDELAKKGERVNIIWKGPLREDDRDQQIQVVENFTARRIQGIVLAPLDSTALVAPVETAIRGHVPVIIVDSALNSEMPSSYIATDNYKGGQLGADHLVKCLNGRGNVILLRYQVGSASTEARESGFMDEIKKYPDIRVISSDQYAGATRDSAYQAAQNLLNRYGKDVQGIFAPCEPVTIGVLMALKDVGKAGGVIQLIGFDSGTQSVDGLKSGDVQGLVVQNPLKMGYLGVMKMLDVIHHKRVPRKIDTGVQVATRENMNDPEIKELIYPPYDKYLKEDK